MLFFSFRTDKNEAKTTVPTRRFPGGLEIAAHTVEPMPAPTLFDHALQFRKTLKRNAEGELDLTIHQRFDNLVAEKRAIHANLDHGLGRHRPDGVNTGQNKGFGPIGIMDIAGAVQKINDLAGLGQGAE